MHEKTRIRREHDVNSNFVSKIGFSASKLHICVRVTYENFG